jgi:hypothetical protein
VEPEDPDHAVEHEDRGREHGTAVELLERVCSPQRWIVERHLFADVAGGWKPVNEPNAYALLGWRGIGFPPGANDTERYLEALEAIELAAAEASARLRQTGLPVASVHSLRRGQLLQCSLK